MFAAVGSEGFTKQAVVISVFPLFSISMNYFPQFYLCVSSSYIICLLAEYVKMN